MKNKELEIEYISNDQPNHYENNAYFVGCVINK